MNRVVAVLAACLLCAGMLSDAAAAPSSSSRRAARLPELTPPPSDALTRAWRRGELSDATYALQRARSLFERGRVAAAYGPVRRMEPRAATLVLRDLALRVPQLHGADRTLAESILARPTDGDADFLDDGYNVPEAPPACTKDVCVHYVTTKRGSIKDDRPSLVDSDSNGVPDYVDVASAVLQDEVWAREIDGYGFRPPKSDLGSPNDGGNAKLDVYLADVGDSGFYGYCTTDDPNLDRVLAGDRKFLDMSAYCVVDNDFSESQFPSGATGLDALRVTAAHEFFHAVQFAYDFFEDHWMLESGSTWMEDEVYDDINDNLQYLSAGALAKPQRSLDTGTAFTMYGNFVWWRYLTEHLDRDVVRRAWERADASKEAAFGDNYSIRATSSAIKSFGKKFGRIFTDFGAANFAPVESYEEGASYAAAVPQGAPVKRSFTLSSSKQKSGRFSAVLDHLTSAYVVFESGADGFSNGRLEVKVDGPKREASPQAKLLVIDEIGTVTAWRFQLDRRGAGTKLVSFEQGTVDKVVLALSNASIKFKGCFQGSPSVFSCGGTPVFDGARFTYGATLVH